MQVLRHLIYLKRVEANNPGGHKCTRWLLLQWNWRKLITRSCNVGSELWHQDLNISNNHVLFSVYEVPTGLTPELMLSIEKLPELLDTFQNRKGYLCCDTNINLLKIINKTHFNTFYENLTQSDYLIQITLSTSLCSNTLIFNIFMNNIKFTYKLYSTTYIVWSSSYDLHI